GEKPAGAVGGGCFTVTQSMTSLTGSSGEDFASILRALGYRMERRPKPSPAVEAASAEITAASEVVEVAPAGDGAGPGGLSVAPSASGEHAPPPLPTSDTAVTESAAADLGEVTADVARTEAAPSPADPVVAVETASKDTHEAQEQQFIEIWRPGGRSDERRGPRRRRRERPGRSVEATSAERVQVAGEVATSDPAGAARQAADAAANEGSRGGRNRRR